MEPRPWLIRPCLGGLFDHLVGPGEEGRRDRQAESFGRSQVDVKLKLRWLLDRQTCRLPASEEAIHVVGGTTPAFYLIRPV